MTTGRFNSTDIELLEKVLCLDPDLVVVAEIVKRAREFLSYPVDGHDNLAALFDDEATGQSFGERKVTLEEVRRFVPRSFFPIDCEEDLIHKAYLALKIGHRSHERKEESQDHHLAALLERAETSLVLRRPAASATSFNFE